MVKLAMPMREFLAKVDQPSKPDEFLDSIIFWLKDTDVVQPPDLVGTSVPEDAKLTVGKRGFINRSIKMATELAQQVKFCSYVPHV